MISLRCWLFGHTWGAWVTGTDDGDVTAFSACTRCGRHTNMTFEDVIEDADD